METTYDQTLGQFMYIILAQWMNKRVFSNNSIYTEIKELENVLKTQQKTNGKKYPTSLLLVDLETEWAILTVRTEFGLICPDLWFIEPTEDQTYISWFEKVRVQLGNRIKTIRRGDKFRKCTSPHYTANIDKSETPLQDSDWIFISAV